MPSDMGAVSRSAPTRGAVEAKPDQAEERLRRGARQRRVPVQRIEDSPYQSPSRRDLTDVTDLVASIRELGLLHRPVVRERADGTHELISGHRRVRAWRLLAQEGAVTNKIPVDVLAGLTDLQAALAVRAANGHREVGPVAEAEEIGVIWQLRRAELGREPTVRDLAAAMPEGRTAVANALVIWRALQDPRLEPLVRQADKAGKTLLVKALRANDFRTTVRALEAYSEGGVSAMRGVLATRRGRPEQVITRRQRGSDDSSYDLTVRVRATMSAEQAAEALQALRAVEDDLARIAGESVPGADNREEA
jgi:hypothetical protein